MKKLAILTVLVLFLSIISVSMVMAQAKAPAKAAPAGKEPIKIGAIYDFAGRSEEHTSELQ